MIRILFYAILFNMFSVASLLSQSNPTGRSVKVMTYNILDGYDRGKAQARKMETTEFLRSLDPDVVAFQELVGFTSDSLQKFAESFGHSYSLLLKENGYPVGLTSKQPITLQAKILGSLWHGMLHATTYGIDFFVIHLSPHSAEIRNREARIITQYMKESLLDQSLYIVLGDFNSLSPFDAHFHESRPDLLEHTRINDEKRGKHVNLVDEHFDYGVMGRFLQFPLIDVTQRFSLAEDRYSFPTPILVGNRLTEDQIVPLRRRIDYILVSRGLALRTVTARVINKGIVDELSDHYPVFAEFLWTE